MGQINSAYQEAAGDPFVAVGILGSTQDTEPPLLTTHAADAAVPTTTGSLTVSWIWWKEQ
jgi:hypothetical protein